MATVPLAPVLVTGSTGNVGREVVRALTALGVPFVAAGTDPLKVAAQLGEGVKTVRLGFNEPASFADAVRGMRGLFLLRPPAIGNVKDTLNVLVDAAISAGVEHIAFLSVDGADRQKWVPHHAVEQHLLARGVSATLLRAGFFAQNLGDAYRRDIVEHDEVYLPAGKGKAAFVDVRDVAELAARSFVEPELRRSAWTLTGPQVLGFDEVAAALTASTGRQIRYRRASILGYLFHLRRQGLSWGHSAIQTLLHVGLRFGNAGKVDPALERLLGHPSHTVRQYIDDHVRRWDVKKS